MAEHVRPTTTKTPRPEQPSLGTAAAARGYSDRKDDYRKRLRRIEGQVKGVARMVEDDTYCIDVLTQISAINKALQAVALGLLDDHLAHCVVDAVRSDGPQGQARLQEASAAIARLVRS